MRLNHVQKVSKPCVAKAPHGFDFSTNLHLGKNLSKSEPIDKDPPNFIPHTILKRIHISRIYLTAYIPRVWDQAHRSSKFPKEIT